MEGDLLGLGGPRQLNDAAIDSGEAVVIGHWAVVPAVVGEVCHWHVHRAAPRQLPDVGEADRMLRAALLDSATLLADLDVARWRPEVADQLMNLAHRPSIEAPLGTPARCADLAARGLRGWAITELALEDDGGAVSAYRDRSPQWCPATARARGAARARRGVLAGGVAGRPVSLGEKLLGTNPCL
ncbi:hypothetical protein [Nocardioides sp. B-3]|uniref:hypothetical protein n=1 Tax=Nocardioides sp. B-3 TaxID=2895565 RepID=UPI00215281AE|nr:hypothetical protein [Nocardioides sp. B-3]UUZ59192.1 hypothetical protein LP418_25285 [Nocardioides sp. B-3]